jgi:DNA ligase 1
MKAFTALYTALDETNKTNEKVEALTHYFASADPADAAWALYFLIGRRRRAAVTSTRMHLWAIEAAGIPDWLFGECYDRLRGRCRPSEARPTYPVRCGVSQRCSASK